MAENQAPQPPISHLKLKKRSRCLRQVVSKADGHSVTTNPNTPTHQMKETSPNPFFSPHFGTSQQTNQTAHLVREKLQISCSVIDADVNVFNSDILLNCICLPQMSRASPKNRITFCHQRYVLLFQIVLEHFLRTISSLENFQINK